MAGCGSRLQWPASGIIAFVNLIFVKAVRAGGAQKACEGLRYGKSKPHASYAADRGQQERHGDQKDKSPQKGEGVRQNIAGQPQHAQRMQGRVFYQAFETGPGFHCGCLRLLPLICSMVISNTHKAFQ